MSSKYLYIFRTEADAQAFIDQVNINRALSRLGVKYRSSAYGDKISKTLVRAVKKGMTARQIMSGMTATEYLIRIGPSE